MFRPTLLLPLLLLGAAALAQNTTLPSGLPPLPGVAVDAQGSITLEYSDVTARTVLDLYERLTKKRLIIDPGALVIPVSVSVKTAVTPEEAIRIIELNLLMNGVIFVPAGKDTLKVIGTGKNPRGFGVPVFSDELELPDNEQIVSFFYQLRFGDAQEVAQALGQYVIPSQAGYTQLLPLPKSSAILITENTAIIRRLIPIINRMDVAPAEVVTEFITLERADAKEVFEKLNEIFGKKDAAATQGSVRVSAGVPRPSATITATLPDGTPAPPNVTAEIAAPNTLSITGATLTEDAIIVGKITLNFDLRTNRIYVVTRPINLPFIRKLIREFDRDVPFGEPTVRALQHVAAGDILPAIVDAIKEPGTGEGGAQGGTSTQGGNRQGQTGNRTASNDNSSRSSFGNDSNGGLGGGSRFGSGSGSSTLSESLDTPERPDQPQTFVSGNTKIIADQRANTIIVLGNKDVKAKVFAIIAKLDVRAPQVMIHTIIGELNLDDNQRFGVNYLLRNGSRNALRGNLTTTPGTGTGTGTGTTPGNDGTGTGAAASGSPVGFSGNTPVLNLASLLGSQSITQILSAGAGGASGFVTAGNAFNAIIDALESTDRFRVTSRPMIFTTNNKKATFTSGEEIAVPVSSTSTFTGGSSVTPLTQSNIQFREVLLRLDVLPLINSQREVTLDIVQSLNEVSGQTIIDGNSVPRIATRSVKTHVSVPNNGTLVIGGLIKQTESSTRAGLPYLSRIPLLGPLFRTTATRKARSELVVMMRPVVSWDNCESSNVREKEMEYFNVDTDLESGIYPRNSRKRVSSEEMIRRSPVPLRQEVECVEEPRLIEGFKK